MNDYDKSHTGKEAIEPHGSSSEMHDEEVGVVQKSTSLNRDLKNRHMQSQYSHDLPSHYIPLRPKPCAEESGHWLTCIF